MKNKFPVINLVIIIVFFFSGQSYAQEKEKWLDSICQSFKEKHNIVGMTIAVIKPKTSYYSVTGLRKQNESDELTLHNNFFLASLSKAFTALIAKKMEAEGVISFDTKFFDLFPELLAVKKAKKYKDITLGDLLSHKARINDAVIHDKSQILRNTSNVEKRYHLAKLTFSKSPKRKNKYSNSGYVLAGMMLEKVAKVPFEELLKQTMDSLSLSYVIGYPNTNNVKDAWGHNMFAKENEIYALSDFNFYANFQLPCWGISMSTLQYAKFIKLHLNGLLGEDNVLKSKNYKELHQTYKKWNYGWETVRLGNYTVSTHDGSGDVFFGRTIIVADEEVAVSIFMNQTATNLKAINTLLENIVSYYKK